jgi:hypothetical protein
VIRLSIDWINVRHNSVCGKQYFIAPGLAPHPEWFMQNEQEPRIWPALPRDGQAMAAMTSARRTSIRVES